MLKEFRILLVLLIEIAIKVWPGGNFSEEPTVIIEVPFVRLRLLPLVKLPLQLFYGLYEGNACR